MIAVHIFKRLCGLMKHLSLYLGVMEKVNACFPITILSVHLKHGGGSIIKRIYILCESLYSMIDLPDAFLRPQVVFSR